MCIRDSCIADTQLGRRLLEHHIRVIAIGIILVGIHMESNGFAKGAVIFLLGDDFVFQHLFQHEIPPLQSIVHMQMRRIFGRGFDNPAQGSPFRQGKLDVYKRQLPADVNVSSLDESVRRKGIEYMKPVSYTHPDVYKRQDKIEIMERAEKIGTYETSIEPYEDCCTVFVPKHPVTRPSLEKIEKSEGLLDGEGLIARAMETVETITVG